jgi:thiol:disulfide interchange protein DsbA
VAALAIGVIGVTRVVAAPLKLVEGDQYRTLAAAEPVTTGKKIEVLEVFSYGCIHCYEFEPALRAWHKTMPADAQLVLMPATFNSSFALFARGYYTAEALGLVEKTHEQVFDALWKSGFQVNDIEQLGNLYLRLGVDREKFMSTASSMGIDAALNTATLKSKRLKLEGTPTIYVDGRYELLRNGNVSDAEVGQRINALIDMARAARRKTH